LLRLWHAHGCTKAMKNKTPQRKPVNPNVAAHGIPGFHNRTEPGDAKTLAGMELDADIDPARVDTGTGDQPGNSDSRSSTPSENEKP